MNRLVSLALVNHRVVAVAACSPARIVGQLSRRSIRTQ